MVVMPAHKAPVETGAVEEEPSTATGLALVIPEYIVQRPSRAGRGW